MSTENDNDPRNPGPLMVWSQSGTLAESLAALEARGAVAAENASAASAAAALPAGFTAGATLAPDCSQTVRGAVQAALAMAGTPDLAAGEPVAWGDVTAAPDIPAPPHPGFCACALCVAWEEEHWPTVSVWSEATAPEPLPAGSVTREITLTLNPGPMSNVGEPVPGRYLPPVLLLPADPAERVEALCAMGWEHMEAEVLRARRVERAERSAGWRFAANVALVVVAGCSLLMLAAADAADDLAGHADDDDDDDGEPCNCAVCQGYAGD